MKNLLHFCCFSTCFLLLTSCSNLKKAKTGAASPTTFSKSQISMIMDKGDTSPMRVFKINNPTDSVLLRTKSEEVVVDANDKVLKTFVKRLYSTVRDSMSLGVGIAAPQVGILKKIIWVQRFDKPTFPFEAYLNPKIVQYSKLTQKCKEGCLSIPDRSDELNSRSYAILIEYDKMDGTHHIEMVEDFTAVVFQHEIDHLDGILYLDHLAKELND